MSHFHFPRFHFCGKASIDPATGNNNYHYPLVNYEPLSGTAVIPPRIYLDNDAHIELVDQFLINKEKYHRKLDTDNQFLELVDIEAPDLYKKWMTSPLGSLEIDHDFHELYKNIKTEKEGKLLHGLCPAYWNYYGTMNFELEDVRLSSVQILRNTKITSITRENSSLLPLELEDIFDAQLSFTFPNGKNSAVMIDVTPTLSLFSQVFCEHIQLKTEEKQFLSSGSSKGALRQMNPTRIENDPSITGSSGVFYHSIPSSDFKNNDQILYSYFKEMYKDSGRLKGLMIRYDLLELKEDTSPDYKILGANSNPARCSFVGTIGPWLENEMMSNPPGRTLLSLSQYKAHKYLGPAFCFFHKDSNLLSLDLITSLPEIKLGEDYASVDLGVLDLLIKDDIGKEHVLAQLSSEEVGRSQIINKGGVYDFQINDDQVQSILRESKGSILLKKDKQVLLKERKIRILSDQTGLYSDQYDNPAEGYFSNGSKREACQIKILKSGKEDHKKLKVMVLELTVLPYGRGENLRILDDIDSIESGQVFLWSTEEAGQKFYCFLPTEHSIMPHDIKDHLLRTGEFINIRVLPKFTLAKEKDEITFEDIKKDFLNHYDLIYPSSGIITPFNSENFSRIRKFLFRFMSDDYWDRYLYMPSTRDLPRGKRKMLFDWLENIVLNQPTDNTDKS